MTLAQSQTDRIVLALALFGTLALVALAAGATAGFTDSILGGFRWVVENGRTARKVLGGTTRAVEGAVRGAGAALKLAKSVGFLFG